MPKEKHAQEYDPIGLNESTGTLARLATGPAALAEPLLSHGFGKNYPWSLVIPGGLTLLVGMVAMPRYEREITAFGVVWGAALAVQVLIANYNHHFGLRQATKYVGYPILAYVIPLGEHLVRRFINPLATYCVATQLPYPAIGLLLKLSAAGQLIVWSIAAWVDRADRDTRDDLEIEVKQRMG